MKNPSQKILLHCCCAPCSLSVVKNLRDENLEPELFWYNPNIHPFTEYNERLACLMNFAQSENLKLLNADEEYGLRFYLKETAPDLENRCMQCYRMRLEKTASFAASNGYDSFSTTLLISPYQDHEGIRRIGEELAQKYNITFFYKDFREFFREGQTQAREKKFYMQKYCGCVFSEEERFAKSKQKKGNSNQRIDIEEQVREVSVINGKNIIFDRLSLLVGEEGIKKLSNTTLLVFGAGGVGSWAAEALVRSGIGKIGIIDNDTICASNVNRQIEATSLTLGQAKASALKTRLLEINPECEVRAWDKLFSRENAANFGVENADYVIDAIDTMNHKLDLIEITCTAKVKLFSSMGMALKLDPSKIKAASIWKTDVCPLARLVRQGLRKREFTGDFTAVYSDEIARENKTEDSEELLNVSGQKKANGSIVTVTASAGLMLASLVINDAIKI